MNCSNCGKDIPDVAKFCPKCGSAIVMEENTSREMLKEQGLSQNGKTLCEGKKSTSNDAEKNFEWKDQYTYIVMGIGFVLAVIIGLAIRVAKNKSLEDNEIVIHQDIAQVGETKYDDSIFDDTTQDNYNVVQNDNLTEENELLKVDVEEEVLNIRDKYNGIVDTIQSDNYAKVVSNNVTAYYENTIIRAIRIPRGAVGNDYAQSFYYDEYGNLIFAYYESNDANRLYFKDSKLIRWRYSVNANNAQDATNYDMDNSSQYIEWENTILNDSYYYVQLLNNLGTFEHENYILPGSDSRYLDISELNGLSAEECRLARNELYARHGRKFDDEGLQKYFESKEWYIGTIDASDFTEDILNDYEIYNRDMIVEYEKEKGYR